ncbi:MAG TPA: Asp-tRNA(Asn)/Glu-tRNA(Gln) amidotransferase subunit GatC [Candidatus Tectomicrobia bacterium]|jgi:aspartyl-tRNA(Asn)/glutamyl-tRNA(Gln) amidotransferase subunit C|nr:Asp-tRNA(Asn)/Glu-tRNA(Gln) amidotransferase subunit GatC [Candidatus Tectomicrobia bacterium]
MITREDVEHVAELARLELTAAEKGQFIAQLNSILTYIEKLSELNTAGVEPTSHVLPMSNVFRDDEVRPSLDRDQALQNAPQQSHFFFKVPRIIEE